MAAPLTLLCGPACMLQDPDALPAVVGGSASDAPATASQATSTGTEEGAAAGTSTHFTVARMADEAQLASFFSSLMRRSLSPALHLRTPPHRPSMTRQTTSCPAGSGRAPCGSHGGRRGRLRGWLLAAQPVALSSGRLDLMCASYQWQCKASLALASGGPLAAGGGMGKQWKLVAAIPGQILQPKFLGSVHTRHLNRFIK